MVAQGGQSEVAVVLHSQDAAEVELGQAFASAFVDRGGTVADSLTPEGDDWAGAITGRAGGTPDVVFLAANALTAGSWIVALRDAGFEGSVMGGPALGSSLLVDIAGEASEGVLFVSPFPPAVEDQPTVDAFRELSGGTPPGPAATWAYSAANQLLDAMDSSARKQGPSLRTNVQKTWLARGDGPGEIYTYVIQPDNIYTVYQPH
jgi:ABC-type branched-subunit amino acid transport system substrate-binding protein